MKEGYLAIIKADASSIIGKIDRNIQGHFLTVHPSPYKGIWAEMLENRKFVGFDENKDKISDPWVPIGKDSNVSYLHTYWDSIHQDYSQRIRVIVNDGKPRGIAQSSIPIIANKEYIFSVWLKQRRLRGAVKVSLGTDKDHSKLYDSKTFDDIDCDWSLYEGKLISDIQDNESQFIITVHGKGMVWIDSVSFMPSDNVEGLRRDTLDLAKALRPSVLRWIGSFMDSYRWTDGVGQRDMRRVRVNPYSGEINPNDFGTDEFIHFCRLVDAEPYICVNYGSGSVKEAAEWVEYCNGKTSTVWGSKRAEYGHYDPYAVKYWGVGNEVVGPGGWEIGCVDGTTYGKDFVEFHRAMKKIDPEIELVAVGWNPDDKRFPEREECAIGIVK